MTMNPSARTGADKDANSADTMRRSARVFTLRISLEKQSDVSGSREKFVKKMSSLGKLHPDAPANFWWRTTRFGTTLSSLMTAGSATFAFRPHEKIREGYLRVLRKISSRAKACGKNSRMPVTEAIHDVRIFIKRLRAMLWFARPALPEGVEKKVRELLKTAARSLAGQRDLAVTRTTLQKLAGTKKPGKRVAVARVARRLSFADDETTGKALRNQTRKAVGILRQAIRKIIAHAGDDAKWPEASERLKKAFQATNKAGKKALWTRKDIAFHAWRKKAKRLLYLTELTGNHDHVITQKRLNKLQKHLGDDHDCVMTAKRLQAAPVPGSDRRRVTKLLLQREARLRKKARKIARRMDL